MKLGVEKNGKCVFLKSHLRFRKKLLGFVVIGRL